MFESVLKHLIQSDGGPPAPADVVYLNIDLFNHSVGSARNGSSSHDPGSDATADLASSTSPPDSPPTPDAAPSPESTPPRSAIPSDATPASDVTAPSDVTAVPDATTASGATTA